MKRIEISRTVAAVVGLALFAGPAGVAAQDAYPTADNSAIDVYGQVPAEIADLPAGPDVEGYIVARSAEKMQVTAEDGTGATVFISPATEIRGSGGFLGLSRTSLDRGSLLNGLPVAVETVQWGDSLVASRVRLKKSDLETAAMIQRGTAQGFAEQTAATEALRGRLGDIDQYNVKGVTNVYFDTNEARLDAGAERQLCEAAAQAQGMDNALLLVIGYTDADGPQEYNQDLSERRAGRVVNHLQQACGWKPYRMLTPTGMAEADPAADNMTEAGKAQNRRVAVNILVSKSVDGI